jgi:hypothetical protein
MHRKDVFAFRFLALSPAHLNELREICPEAVSRPVRKREGLVTGVFDLRDDVDYSWIGSFIEERRISENDYGLFVSVSTSSDSEIISLPQFVADIFRKVGGGLDFSFTVLSDE